MVYIVVYKYNPIKYKSLQKSPKSSTSMARSVAAAAAQARRRAAAPGRGPHVVPTMGAVAVAKIIGKP